MLLPSRYYRLWVVQRQVIRKESAHLALNDSNMAARTSFFGLSFLVILSCALGFSWESCGEGTLTVESLALSPDDPKIGDDVQIIGNGTLSSQVTQGKVSLSVSLAGFKIYSTDVDICDEVSCPIPAGPISLNETVSVPSLILPGEYSLKADGGELGCIKATVKFRSSEDTAVEQRNPRESSRAVGSFLSNLASTVATKTTREN